MRKISGKVFQGGKKVAVKASQEQEQLKAVSAIALKAAEEAVFGHSYSRRRRPRHPAYAPWSAVINTQLKSKDMPVTSSQLSKFLGVVEPPSSDTAKLVTNFVKLHNRQNPAMWRDRNFKDRLITLLSSGQTIGIREVAKLLSN